MTGFFTTRTLRPASLIHSHPKTGNNFRPPVGNTIRGRTEGVSSFEDKFCLEEEFPLMLQLGVDLPSCKRK